MTAAIAGSFGGILGLFVLCGVLIIIVLFCKQKRWIQNVQQRRQQEIHSKRTEIHCNPIAGSLHLKNQQSNVEDHEQLHSNIEIADTEDKDDNVYDDIVNVANLTNVDLIKNRERFITADSGETTGEHDSEYDDYEDIIISTSVADQPPLGSLTIYDTNPAYTTCQEYLALTASALPLPELTTIVFSQSDLDDYENVDEVNLSEELVDNDAYIKDLDYLQIFLHDAISTSSTTAASPQVNTSSESSVSSDMPKSKLTNESQLSTKFHNNDISQRGVVSHHYENTTELQGNTSVLVSHQGQSTPLDKGINSTLGAATDNGGNASEGEDSATKFPNLLSTDTDQLDHVYNSADSVERNGQITSKVNEIGDVGEFDTSATDIKDGNSNQSVDDPIYTFDRLDPNYTYDRLGPRVCMDPEQLHADKSSESNNAHSTVRDVSHSKISPVTHWKGEWSNEDLMRANAVYQDKKFDTLV